MAERNWDFFFWQRASDLFQQAERIQRNFLQFAAAVQYRLPYGRISWTPPLNVIETDQSLWVIVALPGVAIEGVEVRLEGRELIISGEQPLPECCRDGELKIWEIPLGRFERRLSVLGGPNPPAVGKTSLANGLLIIELRKQP